MLLFGRIQKLKEILEEKLKDQKKKQQEEYLGWDDGMRALNENVERRET